MPPKGPDSGGVYRKSELGKSFSFVPIGGWHALVLVGMRAPALGGGPA
ncbi:MAG: hypothetical protein U0800_23665 [Isosphaeraceae bacterium]